MSDLTELEPGVLKGLATTTIDKLTTAGIHTVQYLATMTPGTLATRAGMGKDTAEKAIRKALDYSDRGYVTGAQLHEEILQRTRLTTGSINLDTLLGGGIESETTLEIFGSNGSGKTQLCHSIAVHAQLSIGEGGLGGGVVWIDTENTFRPDRIAQIAGSLGLDPHEILSNIFCWEASNALHQVQGIERMEGLLKEENIKLVIVDSMMSHLRSEYLGRGTLAERQNILNDALHKLKNLSKVRKLTSVYTNQVVSTPDIYTPLKPAGGNIMGHAATTRIFIKKSSKGAVVVTLTKSPYLPDGQATFVVDEYGIRDTKKFLEEREKVKRDDEEEM